MTKSKTRFGLNFLVAMFILIIASFASVEVVEMRIRSNQQKCFDLLCNSDATIGFGSDSELNANNICTLDISECNFGLDQLHLLDALKNLKELNIGKQDSILNELSRFKNLEAAISRRNERVLTDSCLTIADQPVLVKDLLSFLSENTEMEVTCECKRILESSLSIQPNMSAFDVLTQMVEQQRCSYVVDSRGVKIIE